MAACFSKALLQSLGVPFCMGQTCGWALSEWAASVALLFGVLLSKEAGNVNMNISTLGSQTLIDELGSSQKVSYCMPSLLKQIPQWKSPVFLNHFDIILLRLYSVNLCERFNVPTNGSLAYLEPYSRKWYIYFRHCTSWIVINEWWMKTIINHH